MDFSPIFSMFLANCCLLMASLTFSFISGIPLLFYTVLGMILIPSECVGSYCAAQNRAFYGNRKTAGIPGNSSSWHIPRVSKSSPKLSKIAEGSLRLMRRPLKGSNWPETWRKLEKIQKKLIFLSFFGNETNFWISC